MITVEVLQQLGPAGVKELKTTWNEREFGDETLEQRLTQLVGMCVCMCQDRTLRIHRTHSG